MDNIVVDERGIVDEVGKNMKVDNVVLYESGVPNEVQ